MDSTFTLDYLMVVIVSFIIMAFIIFIYIKNAKNKTVNSAETNKADFERIKVLLQTNKGDMLLELRQDLMPLTVNNFMKLVNIKFYNGLLFHRIEPFLIQSGDPSSKGMEAPKWTIKFEIHKKLKHKKYAIGMARLKGLDTACTQFYILKRDVKSFDGKYSIFGYVIKGFDVVEKLRKGDTITNFMEVN